MPSPAEGYAMVFRDYFSCGLRLPSVTFLREVFEEFQIQIHHLTPNGFLTLSKFYWACESYDAEPNVDTFCTYYELQRQPKKVKVDGVELVAQYGNCIFMVKRQQEGSHLEISYC
jgi:hypothetical protein